jgi:RNA polymerase sigma factor (sigma-70 family)
MIGAEPQLVEAARSGDIAAVERLLVVCQPDLRRFARRTCSSGEDAEDAVQIALWQLYRKIGALRAAATFATWMFRIIERECYRLFRARDRLQAMDQSLDKMLQQDPLPVEFKPHSPDRGIQSQFSISGLCSRRSVRCRNCNVIKGSYHKQRERS